jgi:peroxiredoxin (alkyl hydroperoxide reductase subunit C)
MSSLITQKAPDFTSAAVMGDGQINDKFTLSEYLNGSYGLLFFYPLDFTFVCPSEILAFDHRMDKFGELNAKVVGVSVDSQFTHLAWRNTPVEKGGLGPVRFPLVADLSRSIAKSYKVLLNKSVALRGTFLIDKDMVIRHAVLNDLPLGRNVDEAVRMVEALQFHEQHGEVCPAGWQKGKEGMKGTPEGVAEYLAKHADEL